MVEILAPVGGREQLTAALRAGAGKWEKNCTQARMPRAVRHRQDTSTASIARRMSREMSRALPCFFNARDRKVSVKVEIGNFRVYSDNITLARSFENRKSF